MSKIAAIMFLVFFSCLLVSCGGGSGSDYSVSFNVKGGDTEVGPGSFRTLVATISKDEGPAASVDVSFSLRQNESNATLQTLNSETNADGVAEAVYQAGISPGTDIVQVKAGRSKASISMRVAGGGEIIQTVILTADPEEVDIGGYSTITVEGRTYDDQPAVGSQVEFSFQENNSGASFIKNNQEVQSITDTLDNNGQLEVSYRAGSSSGHDIIEVTFRQAIEARDTISINVGQGKALGQISLQAYKSAEPTEWTIQASVRDRDGNLAPNVLVNFSADNGNLSSPSGPSEEDSSQTSEQTNTNGIAEATLTDTYWSTIYAQVEDVEQQVKVSVDEYFEAGSVELVAPQEVAGESVQVRALVKDKDNAPLIDIPVNFHANQGTLQPANAPTDMYGEATTTLSVQKSGQVRVWANVGNVSVSDVITIDMTTEPEPASIELNAPATSETSTASIRAIVRDEDGAPIPDYEVTFFADKGSLSSTNVTTDANGIAIAELTMEESGTVQFTVSAGSITKEAEINFELSEEPEPASLELDVVMESEESSVPIRVLVLDQEGNPLPDVQVSFNTNKGRILGFNTIRTDENGIATNTLSYSEKGDVRLTVTAGNITKERTITFGKPEPARLNIDMVLDTEDSSVPIQVVVFDENGNRLEGIEVSFFANKGSITSWDWTDDNGAATATLRYHNSGEVRVTITAGDVSQERVVTFL